MSRTNTIVALLLAAAVADVDAAVAERGSYGFVRELDGASFRALPDGDRTQLERNEPLLTADRLWSGPGSRLDARLADGTTVQLAGDTELVLDELGLSSDADEVRSTLHLVDGELTLQTYDLLSDAEPPRVDLPNATVYTEVSGSYRLRSTAGWSEIVVRSGYAEVLTERGSSIVRHGERLVVEGDRWVRVQLSRAPESSPLERWVDERVDPAYAVAESPLDELAPELSYASTTLGRAGSWIEVDGGWGWQPRVDPGWRPYWDGRWVSTPSGYTWVSYEPWGWAPYHYGRWSLVGSYGWVWFPGRIYAPAHVYWYFGPSYVGWCPIGSYTSAYHYRGHVRYGVHGWAHGRLDDFRDWSFVSYDRLHERGVGRYGRTARQLRETDGIGDLPRGILATDTRPLAGHRNPAGRQAISILEEEGRQARGRGSELADLSDFVARRPQLRPNVEEEALRPPELTRRPLAVDRRPPEDREARHRPASARGDHDRAEPGLFRRPLALDGENAQPRRPSESWRSGEEPSRPEDAAQRRSVVRRIIDGYRGSTEVDRQGERRGREEGRSSPPDRSDAARDRGAEPRQREERPADRSAGSSRERPSEGERSRPQERSNDGRDAGSARRARPRQRPDR